MSTNLRRLQVGQRLGLALDPDGRPEAMLTHLVLPLDAATEIHLVRGEDGDFAASSVDRKLRIEHGGGGRNDRARASMLPGWKPDCRRRRWRR